jgi:uncharacterized protein (DUF305 family)
LASALVLLGGCVTINTQSADESTDSSGHNAADVSFLRDMIPHHQQALVMSDVAIRGAKTDELQALARRIKAAQTPEIEQMSSWLDQWGEDVPDLDAMGHMMMGHGDQTFDNDLPGMMDADQMRRMSQMMGGGLAFDSMWVRMMILHHQGAVQMAEDELANGQDPDVLALAQNIKTAQTAEIEEMRQMLAGWN